MAYWIKPAAINHITQPMTKSNTRHVAGRLNSGVNNLAP